MLQAFERLGKERLRELEADREQLTYLLRLHVFPGQWSLHYVHLAFHLYSLPPVCPPVLTFTWLSTCTHFHLAVHLYSLPRGCPPVLTSTWLSTCTHFHVVVHLYSLLPGFPPVLTTACLSLQSVHLCSLMSVSSLSTCAHLYMSVSSLSTCTHFYLSVNTVCLPVLTYTCT